jgi:hypothetical protein
VSEADVIFSGLNIAHASDKFVQLGIAANAWRENGN